MDLMVGLLKILEKYDSILVIEDRPIKLVHCLPVWVDYNYIS